MKSIAEFLIQRGYKVLTSCRLTKLLFGNETRTFAEHISMNFFPYFRFSSFLQTLILPLFAFNQLRHMKLWHVFPCRFENDVSRQGDGIKVHSY